MLSSPQYETSLITHALVPKPLQKQRFFCNPIFDHTKCLGNATLALQQNRLYFSICKDFSSLCTLSKLFTKLIVFIIMRLKCPPFLTKHRFSIVHGTMDIGKHSTRSLSDITALGNLLQGKKPTSVHRAESWFCAIPVWLLG